MSSDPRRSQTRDHRHQHTDNTRHHSAFVHRPVVLPAKVTTTFSPTNNNNTTTTNTPNHHRQRQSTPSPITAQEKANRMKLAETTSRKEAILELPETQSREIFSAYALFEQSTRRPDTPMVNLPDSGKSINGTRMGQGAVMDQRPEGQCGTDDDESDDTDVEEDLFIKLEQELNNNDDAAARRRLAGAKDHQPPVDATTIQTVFTFPSDGYFSPGASFLSSAGTPGVPATTPQADMTPGPRATITPAAIRPAVMGDRNPPTINVRIVGGEVIMSPAQEQVFWAAPTSVPENCQTRTDEEVLYGTHPFSLRPPPHLTRSRRVSRIHPQQQQQHPTAVIDDQQNLPDDGPETRSPASSKNSYTSAVSPRFMALRKLSESGLIPTPSDLNSPDQQLLHKIEQIFEVQLKASVSEIMWRATESHRDAQRYWEEQKQEILEFGSSLLKRLNEQSPSQEHSEKGELEMLRKQQIDMENEVMSCRLKQMEQSTELEAAKKQNAVLMGQVETTTGGDSSGVDVYTKRIEELEEQIRELKQQQQQQQRLCAVDAELQTDPDIKSTAGVPSGSGSGSGGRTDWADVMDGEFEWEKKYRDLEARYSKERPELEKKITALETKLKHKSYTPMSTTEAAAAAVAPTAMATSSVERVQRQDRQRKHKSMTTSPPSWSPSVVAPREQALHHQRQSYYMNEAGHLTFTTEINGRLSQYTVKLPTKESNNYPTTTTTTHPTITTTTHTISTRLNPRAQPFKASI